MNINFHPRNLTQKTAQRIWAIFYVEKQRIRIDTNQFILPSDWSRDKQRALTNNANAEKINKLLKEQKNYIDRCATESITQLSKNKKRFYKVDFEKQVQDKFNYHFKIGENKPQREDEVVDFISFIDKYIESRKELSIGTLKSMRSARKNIVMAFNLVPQKMMQRWEAMSAREKNQNPDFLVLNKQLEFEEINKNWMMAFHNWLLNATFKEKNKASGKQENISYSKNYIAKELKIAKLFANAAADEGLINNLTFRSVKASWEEADTIALSWEEINKLKSIELEPDSIEGIVRNLFVFNCYCGLRWSDLVRIDKSRFSRKDNQLFITIRMKKTDSIVYFPILPSAEQILKIYNYKIPYVCNAIFNERIKQICLQAGITELETKRETRAGIKIILSIPRYKMVSSHTGRRSFATNFEAQGVALNELMAVTGHTSEKTFRNYVKKRIETKFSSFLAIGANL